MFGSLNHSSIALSDQILVAGFGSQFCVFNASTQILQACLDVGHQGQIVAAWVDNEKDRCLLQSLDGDGVCVATSIEKGSSGQIKCGKIQKFSITGKKQQIKIMAAAFISSESILFINSNKKLQRFSIENKAVSNLAHQSSFGRILTTRNDAHTYIIHQNQKKVSIYHKESQIIAKQYIHDFKVTSMISIDKMLVVGDEKGKITLLYDYFNEQKGKKNQFNSVLEWHTGPVLALCSNGQYIYSAGEESVVVLWHTRDLSRDFLPRVGTAIRSLLIKPETNQIVCGLADNTIKVIDLSRDKETYSYKTLVDPKGYAPEEGFRFSPSTTSFGNGILCLNSLPGKVQFINFSKNAENAELEVVPRNLVNSINSDRIQPHRINSFAFSEDRSVMMVSLLVPSGQSYLKFYRKGVQGYELINKIQNPHSGPVKECLVVQTTKGFHFLTFSLQDRTIRVWSEFKEKKKSIIETNEVYWRCIQELKFRNLFPTAVSTHKGVIAAVYGGSELQFYHQSPQGTIVSLFNVSSKEKIKQIKVIQFQNAKEKVNVKVIVVKDSQIQTWTCSKLKNEEPKANGCEKLKLGDQIDSYFIVVGTKETAVITQKKGSSHILILENKTLKFTASFDSDTVIETAFWMSQRLILIGSDLTISALDGHEFIKFQNQKSNQDARMEEESTEIRNYGEFDIFKLNQRWVERESIKNKKKIEDCIEGLHLYPNCTSIWSEMSSSLLL